MTYKVKESKVVAPNGETVAPGKNRWQLNGPTFQASLNFYAATGWSLVVEYYEAQLCRKAYRRGRVTPGPTTFKKKRFITPLNPEQAAGILNGSSTAHQLTRAYHRNMA